MLTPKPRGGDVTIDASVIVRTWNKVHTVEAEEAMRQLGYSSKLNADGEFMRWLFELGRARAGAFLAAHYDKIGVTSSTDIAARFF